MCKYCEFTKKDIAEGISRSCYKNRVYIDVKCEPMGIDLGIDGDYEAYLAIIYTWYEDDPGWGVCSVVEINYEYIEHINYEGANSSVRFDKETEDNYYGCIGLYFCPMCGRKLTVPDEFDEYAIEALENFKKNNKR